ncbi:MAG: peptidase M20 [Actinomycetota bacterium]|jgi:glutamate carboxypeptidase|nr:MAG: peptidase M20 [Actinomycetota bacterium]
MDVQALRDLVAPREEEFVEALGELVAIDSGSFTPDGVNAVADRCEARMRAGGWEVERRPHEPGPGEPQLGDLLIGRLRGDGGPRILLVGHMDTVFDPGTAAERPFRVDRRTAYGPGVSDMKGGLLLGWFAVETLQRAGFSSFEQITYVCNPDEEIGSPFSAPVIRALAPEHDAAFVLESARANGDIVSARKGVTDYAVAFEGRAAHAGVEPEKGRSAVLAAAHATVALQALNDRWPGVTVNVGVIRGGTRPNVVPAACELQIDVRAPTEDLLATAEQEVDRLLATPAVEDVRVHVRANAWHRPMEKTEATARLARIATRLAEELGFTLRDAATGGASDANTTSAAGTPTLDGLGPVGGDDHSPSEWIDLGSIVPRTALLAGLIANV